ncbi:hypothetical protein ACFQE1_00390 [Halobium palmae]|uniref:DUF8160 domain-containing protein n=1 Tax=Halobium palmae TaxID=1776492 RepID=A0ABD5RUH0_9EURY
MSDDWGRASGISDNSPKEDDNEGGVESEGTDEVSQDQETGEGPSNIREAWDGRFVYLPPDMNDEVDDVFFETNYRIRKNHGVEIAKNRHFYPALIRLALDAMSDQSDEELAKLFGEHTSLNIDPSDVEEE